MISINSDKLLYMRNVGLSDRNQRKLIFLGNTGVFAPLSDEEILVIASLSESLSFDRAKPFYRG